MPWSRVTISILSGHVQLVLTPSPSGYGQTFARCPSCKLAVGSHYAGAGPLLALVRVGTLDDPAVFPPDIHIFTASKQPWVILPPATPAVAEYYEREMYWPAESLERRRTLQDRIDVYLASRTKMG